MGIILLISYRCISSSSAVYGPPKGGNPFGVMSPVDSAIGSGVTSGVTTNAPSAVAEGDLEDFKDEEPGSAGFPTFQAYPEQQRGRCNMLSVCVCVCVCVCDRERLRLI